MRKVNYCLLSLGIMFVLVVGVVYAQQINQPPEVKAIACPTELTLGEAGMGGVILDVGATAVVSDDGLPEGGSLSYQWTMELGPRPVEWLDPNVLHAKACFTFPGDYYFRLDVTDGELSASDIVKVTIIGGE